MSKLSWTPWHQVVTLREDLKSGEQSLSKFAADLHEVVVNKGRTVYCDPAEFFALTYPTFNLRELAKDVALRLAGRSDKAIRQLALTYGGGKTHTLITLLVPVQRISPSTISSSATGAARIPSQIRCVSMRV